MSQRSDPTGGGWRASACKDHNSAGSGNRHARHGSSGTANLLWTCRRTLQGRRHAPLSTGHLAWELRGREFVSCAGSNFSSLPWCSSAPRLGESKHTSCNLSKSSGLISKTPEWSRGLWRYFKGGIAMNSYSRLKGRPPWLLWALLMLQRWLNLKRRAGRDDNLPECRECGPGEESWSWW